MHILGFDIPEHDYLTGHEWEQVELLLADLPKSELRADLLTLKIFVDSRTSATLDVDDIMSRAVDANELRDANETLLRPFANARKERAEKQFRTPPRHLQIEQLMERKQLLEDALAAVNQVLSENGGGESKRSSTTTTPGSASKAGKPNRSKKPSN